MAVTLALTGLLADQGWTEKWDEQDWELRVTEESRGQGDWTEPLGSQVTRVQMVTLVTPDSLEIKDTQDTMGYQDGQV